MNKVWHSKNKMPSKATLEQRIDWHTRHQKHCGCRGVPKSLLAYVKSESSRGEASSGKSAWEKRDRPGVVKVDNIHAYVDF